MTVTWSSSTSGMAPSRAMLRARDRGSAPSASQPLCCASGRVIAVIWAPGSRRGGRGRSKDVETGAGAPLQDDGHERAHYPGELEARLETGEEPAPCSIGCVALEDAVERLAPDVGPEADGEAGGEHAGTAEAPRAVQRG